MLHLSSCLRKQHTPSFALAARVDDLITGTYLPLLLSRGSLQFILLLL